MLLLIADTGAIRKPVRRASAPAAGVLAFVLVCGAGGAEAHSVRFVASYGADTKPCNRVEPCRTLQRGIDRTDAGSELVILDAGEYGSGASIDKSITISAVGVAATLIGEITIDNPEAIVVLRGLHLRSGGSSEHGISVVEAKAVHIEDCEIEGFERGISVSVASYPTLTVSRSHVHDNNAGLLFRSGSPGRLLVDASRFENNLGRGIEVISGEATISRTVVAGNGSYGISQSIGGETHIAWTISAHNALDGYHVSNGRMTLQNSVAHGNGTGLGVGDGGTARIASSLLTRNGAGLLVESGGELLTLRNNTIRGNDVETSGTITTLGAR